MARRRPPKRRQPPALPAPTELTTSGYIHDGRALARFDGRAVFVAGALENERVEVRFTARHSRYLEARTTGIVSANPQRVEPRCRHFGRCGGCDLQHMPHSVQLEIKQQAVLDQLSRAGASAPLRVLEPLTASAWGYRSRARVGVRVDKAGAVTLGFRQAADKQLVNLTQCPVLAPALEAMLEPLRHCLQKHGAAPITHIELIDTEHRVAAVLRHVRPLSEAFRAELSALAVDSDWSLWLRPDTTRQLYDLEGESVDPRLTWTSHNGARPLQFHPGDFTQVNPAVNRKMIDQALNLLAPGADEHVLDLFCGIGNFSLPLAELAGRVSAVEAVEPMVLRGRENARAAGLENIEFVAADLSQSPPESLLERIGAVDALLLDPPRAGAREVCENMTSLAPSRVLYVSCNPATLARDIVALERAGYTLDTLGVMEMFAQTAHVETMALLKCRR